ncbi:MAG: DUF1415 domain-containing protein [endosymbiont of Galathealinum brachiosum]|uniref:DUF1415 domain-containing protein n=1 Tax=endosymbiont of Galathealinum brachiosum TaxID=2200906 RepID=A0A370D979_9GAMM|nr:MAG: DUF1415 domain-containing protein [endosymbiont of Galathealinum brachiosum]
MKKAHLKIHYCNFVFDLLSEYDVFQATLLYLNILLIINLTKSLCRAYKLSLPEKIIQQTQCWLKTTIIGLNFCPFANKEFKQNSIRYSVFDGLDLESNLHALADEFQHLDNNNDTETSLLMFTNSVDEFEDFLELIEYSNELLDDLGYCSTYQIAHFHPQYCFDGVEADDASNYTNRSPYPTLHLIREASLQLAIENYPDTSEIPENNIKLARELGSEKLDSLLKSCNKIL